MKLFLKNLLLIVVISGAVAVNAETAINLKGLSLKNAKQPYAQIITGGQPSLVDLTTLKELGVKNIINMRTLAEFEDFDESKEAKKHGLNYISLEISGAAGVTFENAKKLDKILNELSGITLVHCASSNRVGALFALRAADIQGKTTEEALAEGQKAGLKSLYNRTEKLLVLRN